MIVEILGRAGAFHHTMGKKRADMTPEERERRREQSRGYYAAFTARATPEELERFRDAARRRVSQMSRKRAADMAPEELEQARKRASDWKRARAASMTPEERARDRRLDHARRARWTLEDRARRAAVEQTRRDNWTPEERARVAQRNKQYNANPVKKARHRNNQLARVYGITAQQWDAMFEAQGGRCAICCTDTPGAKGWVTDHCHSTSKVRGVLCTKCNTAIGLLCDTPTIAAAALAYLERHRVCDHLLCSTGPSGTCLLGSSS